MVNLNTGEQNSLQYHPNCEELLYLLSEECDCRLGDDVFPLKVGMMIRIQRSVKCSAINIVWQPVTILVCYSAVDRQTVFCEDA